VWKKAQQHFIKPLRRTERQTILIARPRLHSMQRSNNDMVRNCMTENIGKDSTHRYNSIVTEIKELLRRQAFTNRNFGICHL